MLHKLREEVESYQSPKGLKALKKRGQSLVLQILELLIQYAVKHNVSDIHIEPQSGALLVRYRIDGILYDVLSLTDDKVKHNLVSSIRVHAQMTGDGTSRRKPQDGRWSTECEGEIVDCRISSFPVLDGEKVVLRLFRQNRSIYVLEHLGCSQSDMDTFRGFLSNKNGIVFVTGPTGSGKTTTLYAGLNALNSPELNIVTLEDPVEFNLPRINQTQIDVNGGLDFTEGLRALVRQDPDVMLVGEIRDRETAEISIRCSLTGHLVLTTIHTNDAPTTISRLIDMGIEPFLIAASSSLIINQRLLRKLCPNCKQVCDMPDGLPSEVEVIRAMNVTLYKARGCEACVHTGFMGRLPVFEFMRTTDEIRKLTLQKAATSAIRKQAIEGGMRTLVEDAMRHIQSGDTSLDEVLSLLAS